MEVNTVFSYYLQILPISLAEMKTTVEFHPLSYRAKTECRHLRGSNSRTNFVSGVQLIGRHSLICDALRVVIRPLNHSGKMPQAMGEKSKMSDSIGQVTFRYKYPLLTLTTYPTTHNPQINSPLDTVDPRCTTCGKRNLSQSQISSRVRLRSCITLVEQGSKAQHHQKLRVISISQKDQNLDTLLDRILKENYTQLLGS